MRNNVTVSTGIACALTLLLLARGELFPPQFIVGSVID